MTCGCERGYRCTPSTLCTVQSAVEDATELYEYKLEDLEIELKSMHKALWGMEDLEIELKAANKRIAELENAIRRALKRKGSSHPNALAAINILEKALENPNE